MISCFFQHILSAVFSSQKITFSWPETPAAEVMAWPDGQCRERAAVLPGPLYSQGRQVPCHTDGSCKSKFCVAVLIYFYISLNLWFLLYELRDYGTAVLANFQMTTHCQQVVRTFMWEKCVLGKFTWRCLCPECRFFIVKFTIGCRYEKLLIILEVHRIFLSFYLTFTTTILMNPSLLLLLSR